MSWLFVLINVCAAGASTPRQCGMKRVSGMTKKAEKTKKSSSAKRVPSRNKKTRHESHCNICKHKDRKEIEAEYLMGLSPYEIVKNFSGISVKSVYAHASATGLDKKRDNTTLPKVRRLIDRANIERMPIAQIRAIVPQLLKLEAQLSGELVEKQEVKGKIGVEIGVSERVQKRVDRILQNIPGISADDIG